MFVKYLHSHHLKEYAWKLNMCIVMVFSSIRDQFGPDHRKMRLYSLEWVHCCVPVTFTLKFFAQNCSHRRKPLFQQRSDSLLAEIVAQVQFRLRRADAWQYHLYAKHPFLHVPNGGDNQTSHYLPWTDWWKVLISTYVILYSEWLTKAM